MAQRETKPFQENIVTEQMVHDTHARGLDKPDRIGLIAEETSAREILMR